MEYTEIVIDGKRYFTQTIPTFRIWSMEEVLIEGRDNTSAKYIPNEGDWVIDPDNLIYYKAIDRDPLTHTVKLELHPNQSLPMPYHDPIVNPIHRIYIDKNITPHVCNVDATFTVGGSTLSHAIVYKGIEPLNNSLAVSAIYHADGSFNTNQVPLVRIASDSHELHDIHAVGTFSTSYNLNNGDLVTVVVFDTRGNVASKVAMLMDDTSHLNDHILSTRTISNIELYSPFIAPDGNVIRRPISIDINDLNLSCVIHYNDGSEDVLPVNTGNVKLLGMEVVSLNNMSLEHVVVLRYELKDGEVANAPLTTNGKFITIPYLVKNYAPNISYNIKLHLFPAYINAVEGYKMLAYINLPDRSGIINVTEHIRWNGAAFNGKDLTLQELDAYIDLGDIDGIPNDYDLHNRFNITINHFGGDIAPHWYMSDTFGETYIAYKPHVVDVSGGTTRFKIKPDSKPNDDWWTEAYESSKPLVIQGSELSPPNPSHISITMSDGTVTLLRKEEIDKVLFVDGYRVSPAEVIVCKFVQKYGDSYLELSVLPLTFL
jgi:hypothetical protein